MSVTDTTTPPTAAPPADPVRAALGDPAVYAQLLRHATAAYRGSKSNIEDIVQTACLRAIDKSGSYDAAKGSITAWVGGFIVFVCHELYRKEGREPRHRPDLDLAEVAPAQPSPEDAVADHKEQLERCLETLSLDDREVLELVHIKGWKQERIAAHYGISYPAARKRVSRALFRVKQLVQSLEEEAQS